MAERFRQANNILSKGQKSNKCNLYEAYSTGLRYKYVKRRKSMKRNMKLITMVICALVIALFTTSCSKDNDIPDAEKNAIQALNNIVGNYKGNLAATYGTTTTIWPGINWTVDKNSTITVNNFPYQLLANGVSKKSASSLYTTLINEKQRSLKLYITTIHHKIIRCFSTYHLTSSLILQQPTKLMN